MLFLPGVSIADFSVSLRLMEPHALGVGGCSRWGGRAAMPPNRDTGGSGPPSGEWDRPRALAPISPLGPNGSLLSMLPGLCGQSRS